MHVVIDLETLGTKFDAAILAIGAVVFDKQDIHETFYKVIELQSCLNLGCSITASTIYWWLGQSDEARHALLYEKVGISVALKEFNEFLPRELHGVWGNSSSFDCNILRTVLEKKKMPTWPYRIEKCFRTIRNNIPENIRSNIESKANSKQSGVVHNALSDALWEANFLIEAGRQGQVLL